MTVIVSLSTSPTKTVEVDIENSEWKAIHYKNLPPFRLEEQKRFCAAYKDGIFPQAKQGKSSDQQIMEISNFHNFLEFIKIIDDEVITLNGLMYLTTTYYDRRGEAWTSNKICDKNGKIVGYCINGFVYHVLDLPTVNRLIFGIVYYGLVNKIPQFSLLLSMLKENTQLVLKGDNEEFLLALKNLLLEKVNSVDKKQ